jgi:formate dehydrogenase subunit gamma
VDINWAKEHHSLWLEEQAARTGPNGAKPQTATAAAE